MEYEIFNIFSSYTLEVLLIALGAFLLTYLIKWPIKKATSKLDESKRKMINIVIMFIPLVLSCVASILYYGIKEHTWATLMVFDSAFSSWIISLSMYAIVSRIWLVIKGIWNGTVKINPELSSDTIKYIKENIKEISSKIKVDEKDLLSIVNKLEELEKLKELLVNDTVNTDTEKLTDVNSEILSLRQQESTLKTQIEEAQNKVKLYNDQLYVSPEE